MQAPGTTSKPHPLDIYGDRGDIQRIFHAFIVMILLSMAAGTIILLSHGDFLIAALVAGTSLPVLAALVLIRRGKFEATVIFLAVLLISMATLVASLGLGIHHISNMVFPLILIIASLVIRRRTMVFLTLFTMGCAAWLVFGEVLGLYQPARLEGSIPGDFFSTAVILIVTAVVVRLMAEKLFKGHRELQQELRERLQVEARLEEGLTLRRQAEEEVRRLNTELEQRVQERTMELEAAKNELEAVSYSISHDLRTPLRAVNGYATILLREHRAELTPEMIRELALIRENGRQMGELVDGLLAYLRSGSGEFDRQPVEPGKIVQGVLQRLSPRLQGRQVDIVVADLPACSANPRLLEKVYEVLISNAVKFTRERSPARIEIGAQAAGDKTAYFVRDNGIGFNMKYYDKLFGIFQRLDHVNHYDGVGANLAIVQRLVNRHGGSIWAESEEGQGATFFFTLC